ncbi:MAG: hypothetical protein ACYDDF_07895 [Thermoplasmatota archaeon]
MDVSDDRKLRVGQEATVRCLVTEPFARVAEAARRTTGADAAYIALLTETEEIMTSALGIRPRRMPRDGSNSEVVFEASSGGARAWVAQERVGSPHLRLVSNATLWPFAGAPFCDGSGLAVGTIILMSESFPRGGHFMEVAECFGNEISSLLRLHSSIHRMVDIHIGAPSDRVVQSIIEDLAVDVRTILTPVQTDLIRRIRDESAAIAGGSVNSAGWDAQFSIDRLNRYVVAAVEFARGSEERDQERKAILDHARARSVGAPG